MFVPFSLDVVIYTNHLYTIRRLSAPELLLDCFDFLLAHSEVVTELVDDCFGHALSNLFIVGACPPTTPSAKLLSFYAGADIREGDQPRETILTGTNGEGQTPFTSFWLDPSNSEASRPPRLFWQGVLTLVEGIGDKREMNKAKEHYVELLKAGKDAAEAFEPPDRRSTSLRFLYRAGSYSHGSIRFDLGGTTGIMPKSRTSCLV